MGMQGIGTVKGGGAYNVKGRDGSQKQMVSFSVVDSLGTTYPCQMWPDDPQCAELAQVIGNMRRQRVQFSIAGYTVRMRKFQDGTEKPQVNFIVSEVGTPADGAGELVMAFTGTVKGGGAYNVKGRDGSEKPMVSFTVVDELGTTYPCQMWPDDPQHAQLAQVIGNARRQQVSFTVAGYTLRMRKFADGTEKPQINFIVSDVAFPAMAAA